METDCIRKIIIGQKENPLGDTYLDVAILPSTMEKTEFWDTGFHLYL